MHSAHAASAQAGAEVVYPESDGKPMAETELHQDWMIRIRDILRRRYRKQRAYVGCNLLLYYEQGNPRQCVAPDCFVSFNCERGRRRTYKTWEEGKSPDVVFEVTSNSTRQEDEEWKARIYAAMGVSEYILYDPTADYLDPPLQVWQLKRGKYQRVQPDATGAIFSPHLNARLHLHEGELVLEDAETGGMLLTEAEAKEKQLQVSEAKRKRAETARRRAEEKQAAEKAAREAAEARVAELQAELAKLRKKTK